MKKQNKNISPEAMQVIGNIQMMREKIFGESIGYNKQEDFETLQWKSIEELRDLQEILIPEWNKAVKGGAKFDIGGKTGGKKYLLQSVSCDIVEDDYEEGESTKSHHNFDYKIGEEYDSKADLIKAMNDVMSADYKEEHFDWETGEGKNIQTDLLVSFDAQGDFSPADKKEKELWKEKKKKLYNAHYWFYVLPFTESDSYAKGGTITDDLTFFVVKYETHFKSLKEANDRAKELHEENPSVVYKGEKAGRNRWVVMYGIKDFFAQGGQVAANDCANEYFLLF